MWKGALDRSCVSVLSGLSQSPPWQYLCPCKMGRLAYLSLQHNDVRLLNPLSLLSESIDNLVLNACQKRWASLLVCRMRSRFRLSPQETCCADSQTHFEVDFDLCVRIRSTCSTSQAYQGPVGARARRRTVHNFDHTSVAMKSPLCGNFINIETTARSRQRSQRAFLAATLPQKGHSVLCSPSS